MSLPDHMRVGRRGGAALALHAAGSPTRLAALRAVAALPGTANAARGALGLPPSGLENVKLALRRLHRAGLVRRDGSGGPWHGGYVYHATPAGRDVVRLAETHWGGTDGGPDG